MLQKVYTPQRYKKSTHGECFVFVRCLYRRVVLRLPELVVEEDYRETVPTARWITCSVFIGGMKDEVAPVTITVPLKAKAEEWV